MKDVFPEDSQAWDLLANEVAEQLCAYYPDQEPDPQKLALLTSRSALEDAAFVLSASRMMLTYRTDTLYTGHPSLMHVFIGYDAVRSMMCEEAKAQTDNSRFRKVALTFDDGPSYYSTRMVLSALRNGAAQATFFCIGFRLGGSSFLVNREHDAGHSIGSHTWLHKTSGSYTRA